MKQHRLIKAVVERLISNEDIGAYCLGKFTNGSFVIRYVGRSDNNLRKRLLDHTEAKEYPYFIFWRTNTVYMAFSKECELWHMHQGSGSLANQIHPDAPRRLPYECPCCMVYQNFDKINFMEVAK